MPSGAPATFIFLFLVEREQATEEALGLSSLLALVALGRVGPVDVHVQHCDRCAVAGEEQRVDSKALARSKELSAGRDGRSPAAGGKATIL